MKIERDFQADYWGDATALLDDLPSSVCCTAEGCTASERPLLVPRRSSPRSTTDFLRAVRTLTAVLPFHGRPPEPPQQEIQGIWTTYVCCPGELWKEVFGEPDAELHVGRQSAHYPFHVWEYDCSDGVVRCIGWVLDRPEGRWVLVVRLCRT